MIARDVAVIGGGIVGLSTALELQERGRSVALIDPGEQYARASFGNEGVISRGSIFTVAGPAIWPNALRYLLNRNSALRIRYSAWPYFGRWLAHFLSCCNERHWRHAASALNPLVGAAYDHHLRLAGTTGATELVKRDGYLKLFRHERTYESTALEREMLAAAGIRASVVSRAEIRDLEPSISDLFCRGLFVQDSGRVDSPGRLVELYQQAFCARGGILVPAHARAIEPASNAVTVHLDTGDTVRGTHAVVAAGVWSAKLIAPLGYRIPYAAERGYHMHFELRPGATLKRPIFDTEMNYGAAQMGNTIRLCTGIELARPDDPPDHTQLKLAAQPARAVLPIGAAVRGSEWVGSRPSTGDGLPVIGRAARHPQLFFAFGHGHIGFSTGPITGRIVAGLISDEPSPVPITAFSAARFD
ncbi:MAG: NAD(P)/FAD-dependent oxidoreductase [Steroidobacterales bacterium]